MDEDKLTAQFSSGQLVIGICVSLFVLLAAFLLGVLVGKYDSSLRNPAAVSAVPGPPAGTPVAHPSETSSGQGGLQTTPRKVEPVTLPPATVGDVNTSQGRVTELPPLSSTPPAAQPAPAQTVSAATPTPPVTPPPPPPPAATPPPETAVAQAAAPPGTSAAPEAAAAAPPVPETPPAAVVTPPPPPPVLEPITPIEPELPAATPPAQGFGVQVISLSGPDRAAKAVECQRKLKDAGFESVVSQYDDGKKYAVTAVGFKDRASAEAASQQIKKIKEFKDCFIKKLS